MSSPTGYEPKIKVNPIWGGNFIVQLGQFNIFVFNPKHVCRKSFFAHPKTLLLPKGRAVATFVFVFACFVVLEYLASVFASRQLTTIQVLLDFGLVFGTINAGIATSLTDPGIVPPELASSVSDDDDNNNNNVDVDADDQHENDKKKIVDGLKKSPSSFKVRAASVNDDLFDKDQADAAFVTTSLNPYLLEAGTHPDYQDDFDSLRLSNCKHCQHMRPRKSAHCPKCHTCVLGFDHHCGFLATDIGERNLRHFIVFIVHCFLCVAMSAFAFMKPWLMLIIFKDGDLLENAQIRSSLVLAVMSLLLTAWALLLFYMSLNYLIMAFVPGSKSTRDVWRRWCGRGNNNNSNTAAGSYGNDPLPEWHPGYQRQQEEKKEREREMNEVRFWKIVFGVHSSLLPRWSNELLNLEIGDQERQNSAPPSTSLVPNSSNNRNSTSVVVDEREELKIIVASPNSPSTNKQQE